MLPTKGYFKDIECPYNERSCWRPYCHFRHKKKSPENVSEVSDTEKEETSSVPTYKPTPKSELAIIHNKSHIPISYVPDLVYRAEKKPRPPKSDKPTYCPTPLSILSSVNRRLSCIGDESTEHIDTIKEIKQNIADAEYIPASVASTQAVNDIDFESLSTEFDLIDEIISSDDKPKTVESQDESIDSPKKSVAKIEKVDGSKNTTDKSSTFKQGSGKRDKKKNKETRVDVEKESKTKSKHEKSDKRDKVKEKSKSSKSNKDEAELQNRHKSKDKKLDKEKHHKSNNNSKESHKSSSKDKHKKEEPKEQEHKKHHRDKSKSKSESSGRKRSRSPKTSTEKKKDKLIKPEKRSKSTSKDVIKNKRTKLDKIAVDSDQESVDDKTELNNAFSDLDVDFENEEDTMMECFKIFNEYKPPQKKQDPAPIPPREEPSNSTSESISIKKRIAHNNPEHILTHSQSHPPSKPKSIPAPGQMLANRYKIALVAQAEREPELLFNEIKHTVRTKRPISLLEAARARKLQKDLLNKAAAAAAAAPSANVVDNILRGSVSQPKPIKIAPVQNVSLITKAKERLAANTKKITIAQTPRGARVAHIPDMSLSNIPDVLQADKSKLPVNVRTRFLTMIAEECVKLYISKEEAHTRALNEEFSCYEKCKVLATYRNSAMLTVNRLRKEIQERMSMGMGLIGEGEDSKKSNVDTKGRNFYDSVKKWLLTDEELDIHGYPRESDKHGTAVIKNFKTSMPMNLDENQKCCARCRKIYHVDDDGWPLFEEECLYHPMKKRTIRGEQMYLCCRSNDDSGCCTSDTHVSDGLNSAELEGFQTTIRPESENDPRSFAVYALDCEMCYTTKGIELTRVTIVDTECKTVYESLVKPLNPIIDYNTRFSGITKEQMDKTSTSILQIQANILHLCNSNTILVGHSLESDLKALKIVHGSVIDTAVLFPHKMGLPHKRALRVLASEYLRKIIQNDVSGHDSAEDAITCMELLKWKLKEELKLHSSEHSRKKNFV